MTGKLQRSIRYFTLLSKCIPVMRGANPEQMTFIDILPTRPNSCPDSNESGDPHEMEPVIHWPIGQPPAVAMVPPSSRPHQDGQTWRIAWTAETLVPPARVQHAHACCVGRPSPMQARVM